MTQTNKHKAPDLLTQAAALLETRGAQYDRDAEGDTFAPVALAMNQLSRGRINLLPKDVALLLALVKITRSYSATCPETILDSYADGLAYLAKAGENDPRLEQAAQEQAPQEQAAPPEPVAESSSSTEGKLLDYLADRYNFPEWATYLTVDPDRSVWIWEELPANSPTSNEWTRRVPETRYRCLARDLPFEFTVPPSCIYIPKEYRENASQ